MDLVGKRANYRRPPGRNKEYLGSGRIVAVVPPPAEGAAWRVLVQDDTGRLLDAEAEDVVVIG